MDYSKYTHITLNSKNVIKNSIFVSVDSNLKYIVEAINKGASLIITKNKLNLSLIFILTLIASSFTFSSWFCLFNILATIIYTYALWQTDTKIYKSLGIIVNGLMIVYDIYIKSVFGVALISVAFVSSIIGYYKENKEVNN
jgi:hypothetical protein